MSLKPQLPREMPLEIAAWGAKHLADDDLYKLSVYPYIAISQRMWAQAN